MIDAKIQKLFDEAQKIVFLTGAGVSTASGIPDYRSKDGLYTNTKLSKPAEYYLSIDCLNNEPDVFYDYMVTNMYYPDAKPNIIHQKQAQYTKAKRATIITQNIDCLYDQTQAEHLLEFHGNLYDIYCEVCGEHVDYQAYLNDMHHANCGGILRPNIVLYGEGLNPKVVKASITAISEADLVVIVGTSMRVYPFAGLINYRNAKADVIAINQEQLEFSFPFTMIEQDATTFFAELN